ncbi:MAG: iron-sulfur cluster assembly accessory protein [Thiotrichales bacterium]|nr:iron-sulfur cluster assembly accessory protein [Thiotrichales bacterium]
MFEVTRGAAKQIRKTAGDGDMEELALRVSANREPDGSISYRMGFDEFAEGDTVVSTRGVDVLLRTNDKSLLQGATLDFVEIEPGQMQFIFMNPNDPSFVPPTE